MRENTKILIDGIPYKILSVNPTITGRYIIAIEHDTSTGTELRQSISELMEKLPISEDKMIVSKMIISWFIDEKLKSGVNTQQILAIKERPSSAEYQIRRLIKLGESIEEILEVLAFTITDKFWSGVLNTSINTIAIPRQDGMTLYEKIKSKMIAERHATLTEVHQATEEEMVGVEVIE
jgi:hypothetical protein